MEALKLYKIKFFGSKHERVQIKQVKMEILAKRQEAIPELLKHVFGYKVINGLKVNRIKTYDVSEEKQKRIAETLSNPKTVY